MKNVRVKVGENCLKFLWWYSIYEGRKELFTVTNKIYERKGNAIRSAKTMAKRIGVPYSDEIIKQHGC